MEKESPEKGKKPHVVCVPYPAQGHINPMLNLAKVLYSGGFHITFVHSEFNHRRLLKSRGAASLAGLPAFRFETIPDGLPETVAEATQHIPTLSESTRRTCLPPLKRLLGKLNSSADVPVVSCIVTDGGMTFSLDAAEELGVPGVIPWTTSAYGFMGYAHYPSLIQKGLSPLKDQSCLTNGYLETVIDWIPAMQGVRLKDLPTFIRTTDPNDIMIDFVIYEISRARTASAIILNTFEELERNVLDPLSLIFPPIFPVGPLHLLADRLQDEDLKLIGSNLWRDDINCLQWLDSKEPKSVVYVNVGSIAVMKPDQLVEFAWGIANSNQPFLWGMRPDLVEGESAVLPPEFVSETKERGLLVSWCPQEEVIRHPAIGVFLTHCGWNSTLESITAGVPLACWPFFAEQQTNCWACCTRWGIGMEVEEAVERGKVERLVRELIAGEKGREMRKRAGEWKKHAEDAAESSTGSSSFNLHKLMEQVLLSPRRTNL
ncbi:7-deoxyloganetin glucosyltransferase-like [Diospyros lotus]|uniref:7-deoxyloganetin glucosyltransferase-like n=1 Tax=Diospyros lotus TaxID=55363 RepID=UPI00224CBF10|nr:7-deoxyloganetin glucosyltransferase-like [Diospyros lotus]